MILGEMLYVEVSDIRGVNPQFKLTCISTGGPATTVTWTRDSITVTEGTETVLNDPVTAQYTHTLTVTGRQPGIYTCTVVNNKPSRDSTSRNVTITGMLPIIYLYKLTTIATSGPPASLYATLTSTIICLFCTPPLISTHDTNNSKKIYYFIAGIAVTTLISILTGAVIIRKIYRVLTQRKRR